VDVDVGLTAVATRSTAAELATPRVFRLHGAARAKAHRRLRKVAPHRPARAQRPQGVARVQERMAWRGGAFTHPHRRPRVPRCALLAAEDWSVNQMTHPPGLAKSRQDAAWTPCAALLAYQAAWAGRQCGAGPPA